MNTESIPLYFRYWGKAEKDGAGYHLLPYHCLDVAAVGAVWWEEDKALRDLFVRACSIEEQILKSYLLFFIAMHDLGKFDVRFQLKVKDLALSLNPLFSEADGSQSRNYDHGRYGLHWFSQERNSYGFNVFDDNELYQWISAVCGHHGRGFGTGNYFSPSADEAVIGHDRHARLQWVEKLKTLFLEPAGIHSLDELPEPPALLAGFCSVCDWLGSNTDFFSLKGKADTSIDEYFHGQRSNAFSALRASGMLGEPTRKG
ncbi:MAG: CRISPR-associated endonuclease Cas3'', partial [Euryarchaeota archaeon]|nr:CRISPR-associated endonuclease Cas3'' [Euryarchaeota archaeon]